VPTFLTTPRMSPALRARVERAVSHRTRARDNAARTGYPTTYEGPRRWGFARLFPVIAFATVLVLGALGYREARRELAAERAALLAELAERRSGLPAGAEGFVARTEGFLVEAASGDDAGDLVDPALRVPGALDAWLQKPAVYVRASATDLRDPAKIGDAARASSKDSFLVCLTKPPPSDSEHDLLRKVRGVYFAGAKVDDETANVRRLAEARLGLAVLSTAFEESARREEEVKTLRRMRKELSAAPVEQAKRAVAAELMIVAVDLPPVGGGREARVVLVDLAAKRVLLRRRLHIEEQGRSPAGVLLRAELEGCDFAFTARKLVAM
jgi:hypothetical protein